MFWKVMIALIAILAIAWIIYGIWNYRENIKEKNRPRKKTEHLEQVRKSFEDYTKKMENFQKKIYDDKQNH